jgi:hypothetical protein
MPQQSEITLAKLRQLHQMPQQSGLERRSAVNRNGQPQDAASFAINVMASVDAQQLPAAFFNDLMNSRPETVFIRRCPE